MEWHEGDERERRDEKAREKWGMEREMNVIKSTNKNGE